MRSAIDNGKMTGAHKHALTTDRAQGYSLASSSPNLLTVSWYLAASEAEQTRKETLQTSLPRVRYVAPGSAPLRRHFPTYSCRRNRKKKNAESQSDRAIQISGKKTCACIWCGVISRLPQYRKLSRANQPSAKNKTVVVIHSKPRRQYPHTQDQCLPCARTRAGHEPTLRHGENERENNESPIYLPSTNHTRKQRRSTTCLDFLPFRTVLKTWRSEQSDGGDPLPTLNPMKNNEFQR